jgi:hypothetical protein
MAECIKCGDYTKFEKGLCLDCYNKKKSSLEDISGLTDREYINKENMIKGRIADTLVEQLFLSGLRNKLSFALGCY